jgi:hypothetical protein
LQGHLKRASNHQFEGSFEERNFRPVCCPKTTARTVLEPSNLEPNKRSKDRPVGQPSSSSKILHGIKASGQACWLIFGAFSGQIFVGQRSDLLAVFGQQVFSPKQ